MELPQKRPGKHDFPRGYQSSILLKQQRIDGAIVETRGSQGVFQKTRILLSSKDPALELPLIIKENQTCTNVLLPFCVAFAPIFSK